MIQLDIFGRNMDKVQLEATKYANDNLQIILCVLIDLLEDNNDFEPSDFLPRNNLHISDETWKNRVYELFDIVKSPVIRTYLKPKYEFLLYCIIEWWEDCSEDDEILPNKMDPILKEELMKQYETEDETAEYLIKALTTYEDYYYIFFQDHDFLPENVEQMVMMYLESPKLFARFFSDIDLNDYRELIPADLKELLDEKSEQDDKIVQVEIEDKLYDDILFCCDRVQVDRTLKDAKENDINDRIRDLLNAKIYTAKDQTRQGISSGGKDAGNLDILIEINKQPIALVEALKLDSVQEKYISAHIDKIFGYDTRGYKTNYLIAYVKSGDFSGFVKRYTNFVEDYEYKFKTVNCKVDKRKQHSELRVVEVVLDRNGIQTKLIHILVHMQD